MKRILSLLAFSALLLSGPTGCEKQPDPSAPPVPPIETQSFAFVSMEGKDEIATLNQWLRHNSDKKVASFTPVMEGRWILDGYIIQFVQGDNSDQNFEKVNISDGAIKETERPVHGIGSLEIWKGTHQKARITAIAVIPDGRGEVKEFTVCYER